MYPYEIIPVDGKLGEELLKQYAGQTSGFVQIGSKKWFYPKKFAKHAEKYYNFEVRKDDLWIVTFPRSGTTFMQELLWLINNDLDYATAAEQHFDDRFPFFEHNMLMCDEFLDHLRKVNNYNPQVLEELKQKDMPGYLIGKNMKSPRHIKTHLPISLLPPTLIETCKVVYVARNPLDVAVSFYHQNRLLKSHDFQGDFEKYWEYFEKGLVLYSPYWEHINEAWKFQNHPNFLFLYYEDLLRDLPSNIKKICTFLNKQMTDDEIRKLADHVHIDNFRKNFSLMKRTEVMGLINPNAEGFIRRGKIGGNVEFNTVLKLRGQKWFNENLSKTNNEFPEF